MHWVPKETDELETEEQKNKNSQQNVLSKEESTNFPRISLFHCKGKRIFSSSVFES